MAEILHDFVVKAPPDRIFEGVTTPSGLDRWWTKRSAGQAVDGAEYELWFGPQYDWRGTVSRCARNSEFELLIVRADADWTGTRVGFRLEGGAGSTRVRFHHTGWPHANENFRTSSYCWAMYLRILRRYLEYGEVVPYERRLEV